MVAAVLSGNRNFEGRIHPLARASYLASPPLVVAFALAGRVDIDLTREPLGVGSDGRPVMLSEIWPSPAEVRSTIGDSISPELFRETYAAVFDGDDRWRALPIPDGDRYAWDPASTYIAEPPFFDGLTASPPAIRDIVGARVLAVLGDSVTTDHISPAGSIPAWSPAGTWLQERGVGPLEFNSYGARRGHHEVMMRGTFGNIRLHNALAEQEGPYTTFQPSGEAMFLYDAAMRYLADAVPLIVLAGKEYGSGSSRDWAAKGTTLLGIRAVLAESFERIHRSNLVGMGVLPLQFLPGETAASLGLTGRERYDLVGLADGLAPRASVEVRVTPTGRPSANDQGHRPSRRPGRGRLLPPGRHPARRAPAAGGGGLIGAERPTWRPARRQPGRLVRLLRREGDALDDRIEDRVEEAVLALVEEGQWNAMDVDHDQACLAGHPQLRVLAGQREERDAPLEGRALVTGRR